jgi:hypothetical protein
MVFMLQHEKSAPCTQSLELEVPIFYLRITCNWSSMAVNKFGRLPKQGFNLVYQRSLDS